jgi:hypothetical protein
MYARDSRYRHQDEVARTDPAGRDHVATALRRPPERPTAIQHVVEQGERLDHLGERYYRRPHRWWEICDANPGVLSPLHLVGQDPLGVARITVPLPPPTTPPAWYAVLGELAALPGVDGASLTDIEIPVPGGSGVTVPGVLITVEFNANSISAGSLADTVAAHGVVPSMSAEVDAAGSMIAVPPLSGRP